MGEPITICALCIEEEDEELCPCCAEAAWEEEANLGWEN